MTQTKRAANFQQPLAFSSFRNWLRLLWENGGCDRAFLSKALLVTAASLGTAPLRIYERARYGRAVAQTEIAAPPIFIIGHWRSGTSHLHNLMAHDPALGYVTMFQAIAPELTLTGDRTLRPLMGRLTPAKRPMDNMALSIDAPQEEEAALGSGSPYSFYHQWSFPRRARYYFDRWALFQDVPERERAEWKRAYRTLLQKATLNMGGRRILLKSPTNTARIRPLLELWPDAKFIHIYRNPYHVLPSIRRLYEKVLPAIQLQAISPAEIDANILYFYQAMMQQYLAERELIPAGNLTEVRFEDLEAQPLVELRRIYDELSLPGFAAAEPAFAAYAATLRHYEKNRYQVSAEVIEQVNRHWQFALDVWGYERLGDPLVIGGPVVAPKLQVGGA